ncbi:MAG: methyltransferase domain-containing protein [Candidatus Gracilibacteria bacterium]|nr:methyltransferase domain-containing protein [Candidatus Gracilibacteria bacterium]MDD5179050.1 methyltransferase domain-containing protein [Candidatus Gracilibacteria bacterium]
METQLTAFILGRNPQISIAELQAVFPNAKFTHHNNFAVAENLPISDVDLRRLGGIIKVGEVFNHSPLFGVKPIAQHIFKKFDGVEGKQVYGVSSYGLRSNTNKTILIGIKKALKETGISSRFANKDFENLSSAQTQFEIINKHGVEILVLSNGKEYWLAETKAVQPFEEFSKRDYDKPGRDARVGMLPPKLAQILINLACGDAKNLRVYDPFCGSGTILTEAALLNHTPLGSDIDSRMVIITRQNLAAAKLQADVWIQDASAANTKKFDVVVSEGYLGPPRKSIPEEKVRDHIFRELGDVYEGFFGWVKAKRIAITLPVYCEGGVPKFFSSDVIAQRLEKLGWKRNSIYKLVYSRASQIVGREITIWNKE